MPALGLAVGVSGCSLHANISWSEGVAGSEVAGQSAGPIGFANPQGQVIPVAQLTSFTISGLCTAPGTSVQLSGPISATVPCTSGTWTETADFSGAGDGMLAVTATLLPAVGGSAPTATLSLVKDMQAPAPPNLTAVASTIFGTSVPLTWTDSDFGMAGMSPTQPYQVQVFANSNCSASAFATAKPLTGSYVVSGLSNGVTYSWSVTSWDAAGNTISSGCSSSFTVNTAPVSISLADSTSFGGYARAPANPIVTTTIDPNIKYWCVSESQSAPPASASTPCAGGAGTPANGGWLLTNPNGGAYTLSAGDGLKTVYLWVADASGTVKGASAPATITLDTTYPTPFTVNGPTDSPDLAADAYLLNTGGTITVSWSASSDTNFKNYTASIVDQFTHSTTYCSAPPVLLGTNTTGITGCSLAVGSSYAISVIALDNAGNPTTEYFNFIVGNPVTPSQIVFAPSTLSGSVTYPNGGSGSFTLSNANPYVPAVLSVASSNNGDFVLGTGCNGATLQPSGGNTCTITVTFNPSWTTSSESATITVPFNNGETMTNTTASASYSVNPFTTTVKPAYPTSGANWNDYVWNQNPSLPIYAQADTACTGSESGNYTTCINGGKVRVLSVPPGVNNCTGLTVTDNLGALSWYCDPHTSPVTIYSTDLKASKSLSTLLNASGNGWNPYSVTVQLGSFTVMQSTASSTVWNNPVTTAPSVGANIYQGNLNSASTIYTITSNGTVTGGLYVTQPKTSLVVYPGKTLSFAVSVSFNCDDSTGTNGSVLTTILCGNQPFTWVEGAYNANGGTYVGNASIVLFGSNFSTIRSATISGATMYGIEVNGSTGVKIGHSVINGSTTGGNVGIALGSTFQANSGTFVSEVSIDMGSVTGTDGVDLADTGSILSNVAVAKGGAYGLNITGTSNQVWGGYYTLNNNGIGVQANGNSLVGVHADNNGTAGILVSGALNTTVVNSILSSNLYGLETTGAAGYTTIHQVTAIANGSSSGGGLYLAGTTGNDTVSNTILDNNFSGLYSTESGNLYRDITVTDNSTGIQLNGSSGTFKGYLNLGANTQDCSVISSTGIAGNGACSGTSATIFSGLASLLNSFVGLITSDTTNTSAGISSGALSYNSITDWHGFDDPFRAWGRQGAPNQVTDASIREQCASGTCQIWSFALKSADSVLLDRSGAGNAQNSAFNVGGSCPVETEGAPFTAAQSGSTLSYVPNAVELINGSPNNNGDGLCEAGETCLYAPNVGAYIGHGTVSAPCVYTPSGGVSAITLEAYSSNGYP